MSVQRRRRYIRWAVRGTTALALAALHPTLAFALVCAVSALPGAARDVRIAWRLRQRSRRVSDTMAVRPVEAAGGAS